MAADDPELSPAEQRAVAMLARTLRRVSDADPAGFDSRAIAAWGRPWTRRRTWLRLGLAAAVVLGCVAAGLAVVRPTVVSGPATRHFDNGTFSFDYPAAWKDLADAPGQVVLGTGTWCSGNPGTGCAEQTVDVSAGRIVVHVWQLDGEPATGCTTGLTDPAYREVPQPQIVGQPPVTIWEMRIPGQPFGVQGEAFVDAWADDPGRLDEARALVASFRWEVGGCASGRPTASLPGTAGHFDNGSFSFDYPTDWPVRSAAFLEGIAVQTYAVLGTGEWHSGCVFTINGGSCNGDTADVSGGRVVVKIWSVVTGPANLCGSGDDTADETLGPNAVMRSTAGPTTTWEIRMPGARFGWVGNLMIQTWADGPAATAQVEALVASFHWDAGYPAAACSSLEPAAS